MSYKSTVAIIGASTTIGRAITKSIASRYRLLLLDEQEQLEVLQDDLQHLSKNAEVELANCCTEASWEADIIIVATPDIQLNEVASKMKEVTNCKTVIHFSGNKDAVGQLQELLPHAKVVTAVINPSEEVCINTNASIYGKDDEAISITRDIILSIK
jgi:ketopantoate reductase